MPTQPIAEPIHLNYEDYCALPEDGRRYEIIDGDLHVSPSPIRIHQVVVGKLFFLLNDYIKRKKLGHVFFAPFDVILGDNDIVQPDLIYVSRPHASMITEKNIQGAPDLLIEVLSPATANRDTRDKRNQYARRGVPFYWIVDPAKPSILELQLIDKAYAALAEVAAAAEFAPTLFPGLAFEPARLTT
ncbi:MAG: Uma2 family endonuclease [Phycisphaerae bacterium]